MLNRLQQLSTVKTIGFTARRTGKPQSVSEKNIEDVTSDLLASLRICFSDEFPDCNNVSLNDLVETPILIQDSNIKPYEEPGPPLFKDGILFSAGYEKDSVLKAFFGLVGTPELLVMIDDKLENLQLISSICQSLGVSSICYHYTALANQNKVINQDIVEFQYQSMVNGNEWVSDLDAARQLKGFNQEQSNFSIK